MVNISVENLTSIIIALISGAASACYISYNVGKTKKDIENITDRCNKLESEIANLRNKLESEIVNLRNKLDDNIRDVSFLKGSMSISQSPAPAALQLSQSNSPRQLSELGKKVLADSKIDEIIDTQYDRILEEVRASDPKNAYQAQEDIYSAVDNLFLDEPVRDLVEQGAFLSGYTPKDVLFVGALNVRDKILKELNLNIDDIDKYDPKNK